jgi:hypothetical protein
MTVLSDNEATDILLATVRPNSGSVREPRSLSLAALTNY